MTALEHRRSGLKTFARPTKVIYAARSGNLPVGRRALHFAKLRFTIKCPFA